MVGDIFAKRPSGPILLPIFTEGWRATPSMVAVAEVARACWSEQRLIYRDGCLGNRGDLYGA